MILEFFVPGIPIAQPRPKAQIVCGRAHIYTPSNGVEEWKSHIRRRAFCAWNGVRFTESLEVSLFFYIPRPRGHFNKRGLTKSAPTHHLQKPDLDNLAKPAVDALSDRKQNGIVTHGIWDDDSIIARLHVEKYWAAENQHAGCFFQIVPIKTLSENRPHTTQTTA